MSTKKSFIGLKAHLSLLFFKFEKLPTLCSDIVCEHIEKALSPVFPDDGEFRDVYQEIKGKWRKAFFMRLQENIKKILKKEKEQDV